MDRVIVGFMAKQQFRLIALLAELHASIAPIGSYLLNGVQHVPGDRG